jgi:hypothetical protein
MGRYCFFLVEETNYDRHVSQTVLDPDSSSRSSTEAVNLSPLSSPLPSEKAATEKLTTPPLSPAAIEMGEVTSVTCLMKTYL